MEHWLRYYNVFVTIRLLSIKYYVIDYLLKMVLNGRLLVNTLNLDLILSYFFGYLTRV